MKPYHRTLIIDAIFLIAGLLLVLWVNEAFPAEPTRYQIQKREAKKAELAKWREARRAREVKYETYLTQCRNNYK